MRLFCLLGIVFLNIISFLNAASYVSPIRYEFVVSLDNLDICKQFVLEEYTYALISHESHVEASLERYWNEILLAIKDSNGCKFQWINVFDGSELVGFFTLQFLDAKRIAIHASPYIERYHILYVKERFKKCKYLYGVTCEHMPALIEKYKCLGFIEDNKESQHCDSSCLLVYKKKLQSTIGMLQKLSL